jgi:hypothetical protein
MCLWPCSVRVRTQSCKVLTQSVRIVPRTSRAWEESTMPLTSKRNRRKEALPVVGVVGVSLSLAGGASAATAVPAADVPSWDTNPVREITLNEEEIADVSLGTFYVFDKENAGTPRLGERFARGGCGRGGGCGRCGGGRGRGCGGRGCGCGGGGCGGCGGGCGCCGSWGVCRVC